MMTNSEIWKRVFFLYMAIHRSRISENFIANYGGQQLWKILAGLGPLNFCLFVRR